MQINRPFKVSPSSINTFSKCSLQFKLRYIDERTADNDTDNLYAVRGSAFHKLMELDDELNLSKKLNDSQLKDYWSILFFTYMTDCNNLPKTSSSELESFINESFSLVKNGFELKKRWKSQKIIGNEKYIRLEFKNTFIENLFLTGKIDLVLLKNNVYTILDWKTSKKIEEDIDNNLQLSIYIYFIHKIYNVKYENIFGALAYPFSKEILFTQRTDKQIKKVLSNINSMLERITTNDFKKDPILGWQPNDCTFCPYTDSCAKL